MIITTLLLAGGNSSRFNKSIPKQYEKLNNIPIICYSIDKFLKHTKISNIQVIINKKHKEYFDEINSTYLTKGIKLLEPIIGGKSRQESVMNGLNFLASKKNKPHFVIIHDAARPFVDYQTIEKLINEVKENTGVVPSLPVYDSIKNLNTKSKRYENVDRKNFITIQTPQIFCFESIYKSHLKIKNLNCFNDDSSIAEKNDIIINFIKGNEKNFKITTTSDMEKARMITERNNNSIRVGQGFDVHKFTTGSSLKLGGIRIPFTKSLLGNSDADVVLHSLTDALLGAIGKGDIGEYFPDNIDKWENADSSVFINHTMNILKNNNVNIINIDITIICEKPNINEYKDKIKKQISSLTRLDQNNINIKATTTENLGFLGREEGIACQTIVLVNKN